MAVPTTYSVLDGVRSIQYGNGVTCHTVGLLRLGHKVEALTVETLEKHTRGEKYI